MTFSFDKCELCPRKCGAARSVGATGFCGAGSQPKIYRWALHNGEEPPISGTKGSGTIFFSHCTLACIYCQNYQWSQQHEGELYSVEKLADIMAALASQGCHNWNLVTPTPWLPAIESARLLLKERGFSIPFVYNTSGFERPEVVSDYPALTDIVLTDLRYSQPETATAASLAKDYVRSARSFAKWSWDKIGPLEIDSDGIARRGSIFRILILPGHSSEAIDSLEWIAENLGTNASVSLMAQYTPVYKAREIKDWNRGISREEYDSVTDSLYSLGFENGWVQDFGTAENNDLLGCAMPEGGVLQEKKETPSGGQKTDCN